jgi:hypothetical protein
MELQQELRSQMLHGSCIEVLAVARFHPSRKLVDREILQQRGLR